MFTVGFLTGFLLAAVFSLIWVKMLSNPKAFQNVMEKEINQGEQKETLMKLEEEVEGLHTQLVRMEEVLSNDNMVLFPTRGVHEKIKDENVRKEDTVVPLTNVKQPDKEGAFISSRSGMKMKKRSEVVGMWEGGRQVGEIARETGLGQGEVELILSLRNKNEQRVARG